ncbi:MAG: hypothetical protein AAF939_15790 [Planctomycetota bacterium]
MVELKMGARLHSTILIMVACAFVSTVGCQWRPKFGPQGTMGAQQIESNIHDPFPSNDLGPKLEGVRPLGFDLPRSEATSLQRNPYARKSFGSGRTNPITGY